MKSIIKKISVVLLLVLVAFSFVACKKRNNTDNTKTYELTLQESDKTLNLEVGDKFTVKPSYTDGANLLWSTSDDKVVSVSDGVITALKAGKATITVKLKEDESKSLSISVTVTEKAPEVKEVNIETILTTYKNNDDLKTKGIVYGIISNGFYMADSELGKIFVNMGSSWTPNVNVGDEVSLTGKFSYISNFPQVKTVTELNVLASGKDVPVSVTTAGIDAIAKLDPKAKTGSYGKVFLVDALVNINVANIYALTDDAGNICWVNKQSNTDAFADYLNKRITLKVIVHNYESSDSIWNVSFTGTKNDITENALSFDDIKEMALEDINNRVPKDVYGRINLPSGHELFTYISYSWAVDENPAVTIDGNKAKVNILPEDHEVTLKVTISDGENSETIDYPVKFNGIVERTISSLKELKVDFSVVKIRGIVVGHGRNQSLSIRTLFVMQPDTKETITVDFFTSGEIKMNDERFTSIQDGDEILVTAEYRFSDRPTVMNVIELEKISSGNSYTQDFDNAKVLATEEDYLDYGVNYMDYVNKLVKIENPYFVFSTSSAPSDTNWVRFGYDEQTPDFGYGSEGKKHFFAFLIAAQNENLGGDSWYKTLDIPFTGKGAKQFPITIYAYGIYVSDTYIAFIIPDQSCYVTTDEGQVEMFLKGSIPNSVENGEIVLPKTHDKVTGEITWTSDNAAIDVTTGKVTASETENIEVKLTAKYTVNGEQYELVFDITVLKDAPISVTELNAQGKDGQKLKVSGQVVGYVSDGNTTATRMGVIIMDPETKELAIVTGISAIGGSYGAYKDSDGKDINLGDIVQFVGTYYLDAAAIGSGPAQTGRHHLDLATEGSVKVLEENKPIAFGDAKVTINNNDDLINYANNLEYGVLVKFVGTKENPICIGGSSSSLPFNIKVFMNKNATSNDETKYACGDTGSQTFSLKSDVNTPNFGGDADWYKKLFGVDGAFIAPNSSNAPLLFVGELYVVVAFRTGTYYQMSIVNSENTQLTKIVSPEQVGKEIVRVVPKTITSGVLTLELPTESNLTDGAITWTASSDIIDLTNKTVKYVDSDTVVTLTCKYEVDGQEYTESVDVTVLKSTSKAEVEAKLFESFPEYMAVGTLTVELLTSVLDVEGITWTVDNTEIVDLENKLVKSVTTDTVVKFTASYTVRGEAVTSEKEVTVSSSVSLDDVKASLAYGIPTEVSSGDLPFELATTHESISGSVTWTSSNEAIDLTNKTVAEIDDDLEVTLTASFTFKGKTETLEVKVTVLGPLSVSKLSEVTEAGVVRVKGIVVAYAADGNSTATRLGLLLKDKVTNDLVLLTGLSTLGGSYGAYVDSDKSAINVGDELFVKCTYNLTTEANSAVSSIANDGRKYLWVTATDTVKKLSSDNQITWDDSTITTITNNDELANFAKNLEYATVIKIVGTAENPIMIGGSGSKSPFNLKVLMNKSATSNDHTKYEGLTFSLKSDTNAANFSGDADWYKTQFDGITGPFVAPKDGVLCHNYTGVMYVVVTFKTGTYYQMSAVNTASWSLSPAN